jgi:hypothetical protein
MILSKSKPASLFQGEAVLLLRAKLLFIGAKERPAVRSRLNDRRVHHERHQSPQYLQLQQPLGSPLLLAALDRLTPNPAAGLIDTLVRVGRVAEATAVAETGVGN